MSRERSFPLGVEYIAWMRTVRWIGWGFGEALIPILIMSLTGSFAEAGLLNSTFEITLLLALPVIGVLAERIPAKYVIVAGALIYPFVGVSYFLAGATGLLVFVVVARVINGIGWGFDSTGIDTYFRRMTPGGSLASSFGLLDTVANLGWVLATLSSIWLIRYFSVGDLLGLVAPFSVLALPFALKARRDHPAQGHGKPKPALREAYRAAIAEWQEWSSDLRTLGLLLLFTETVEVLIAFFIPIDIYLKSNNLTLVILFTAVGTLPSIFGYVLGRLADHREKHHLAAVACVAMSVVLFALALPVPYAFTILAGLVLGILIELLSVLQKSLATKLTPAERWGRLDSVFQMISGISDLAAPVLLGVLLDLLGFPVVAGILSAIALLLALVFILTKHPRPMKLPGGAWLHLPPPEHSV